jgi:hypothetical protein
MRRVLLVLILMLACASSVQALSTTTPSPCYAEEGICAGDMNIVSNGQCPAEWVGVEFAPEVKFHDEWTIKEGYDPFGA